MMIKMSSERQNEHDLNHEELQAKIDTEPDEDRKIVNACQASDRPHSQAHINTFLVSHRSPTQNPSIRIEPQEMP